MQPMPHLLEDTHLPSGILPESVEIASGVFFCPMQTGNTGFLVTEEGIVVIDTGYAHDRRSVLRRIRRYFTDAPLRCVICTDTQGGANMLPLIEETWQRGTMAPILLVQRNQHIACSSCFVQYDEFLALQIGEFLLNIRHFGRDGAWIHIVSHRIIFSGSLLQTGSPEERASVLSAAADVLLPKFGVPLIGQQFSLE